MNNVECVCPVRLHATRRPLMGPLCKPPEVLYSVNTSILFFEPP